MPSFAFVRISFSFLALLCAFSGCVFIDQFKASLQQSPAQPSPGSGIEKSEEDALLLETLQFAKHIKQMTQEERNKTASSLRQIVRESVSPQDRLAMAFLALYVDEKVLPLDEGLSLLDYFEDDRVDHNQQLAGLVSSLRQALSRLLAAKKNQIETRKELNAERQKSQNITDELKTEKKKNDEMAQKLQKLLEIEKIMEQRK